jgi:hypothetical protein
MKQTRKSAAMKPTLRLHGLVLVAALPLAGMAAPAGPNNYPTSQRVLYVEECMKAHPGGYYEMVNKCSCAVDKLAEAVSYDDYVNMTTVVNAMSIGGERGSELRDNETVKPQIKRYRDLQAKVQKSCFITSDAK